MAGVGFSAQIGKTSTGTSAKTMLQIQAATNQRAVLDEVSVSFDGTVNNNTPVLCELVRQTSAGTMSALTLRKANNSDGETLQTAGQQNATAEPTDAGDVPISELIHPQGGMIYQLLYGKELAVKGGERLGLRLTAAQNVNAVCRMKGQE
jgi:hypothetical protein